MYQRLFLWVSNSGSPEIPFLYPSSQVGRTLLGDLVLSGLLSKQGSGNCWSQTTPLKGTQRKSPTWARLIRWPFEISG